MICIVSVQGIEMQKYYVIQPHNAFPYSRTPPRRAKNSKCKVVRPTVLRKLSAAAVESGSEEDTDWASSSEDEEEDRRRLMAAAGKEMDISGTDGAGRWWCNVL